MKSILSEFILFCLTHVKKYANIENSEIHSDINILWRILDLEFR